MNVMADKQYVTVTQINFMTYTKFLKLLYLFPVLNLQCTVADDN